MNNALKAVSTTRNELRTANYIVLFGRRDLEGLATDRRNGDGTHGEYFTKATIFESPYTGVGRLYVDFEHATDVLSPDDVLGYVDWKTAKVDEKGMFVQRVLNRRSKYIGWLEDLIAEGMIGTSSEAIPGGVVKAANGEIRAWPLRRDTLTVMPMQPEMMTQNTLRATKALAGRVPSAWKALQSYEAAKRAQGGALVNRGRDIQRLKLELELMELYA